MRCIAHCNFSGEFVKTNREKRMCHQRFHPQEVSYPEHLTALCLNFCCPVATMYDWGLQGCWFKPQCSQSVQLLARNPALSLA